MPDRDPYLEYLQRPTRERYTHFVLAYAGPVQRFVKRIVASEDLVHDVVQETFLELGRKRKRPDDVANPRSYILGAAFHLAQRHLRGAAVRARHERRAGYLKLKLHPAASDEATTLESLRRLHAALDSLPAPLRAAMHLRAVEGLSYRDISDVTGCSVNVVTVRVYRARKRLRDLLGEAPLAMALVSLKELCPDGWLLESTRGVELARAGIRGEAGLWGAASMPAKVGLPMGLGIVCLCVTVLGLFFAGGATRFSAREAVPLSRGLERERNPVRTTESAPQWEASPALRRVPRRSRSVALHGGSLPQIPVADGTVSFKKTILPTPKEGDPAMSHQASALAPVFVALGISAAAQGADLGDLNNDGRVSAADAYFYWEWVDSAVQGRVAPVIPEPGSIDFVENLGCSRGWWNGHLLYFEAMRRASMHPLPHFTTVWPGLPIDASPRPPADKLVEVSISRIEHKGNSGDAEIEMVLRSEVPLRFAAIVLQSSQVRLRPRPNRQSGDDEYHFFDTQSYIISGGLLAYNTKISPSDLVNEWSFRLPVTIPRGTHPGEYVVDCLPGTEVVTDDAEVLVPVVRSGVLEIQDEILEGHDLPLPPLEINIDERHVHGSAELRLIGDAAGSPGDTIHLKLQGKFGRPVNFLSLVLFFDALSLHVLDAVPLLTDPSGIFRPEEHRVTFNNGHPLLGNRGVIGVTYMAEGNAPIDFGDRRQPSLNYITPLGEWVDVANVTFSVVGERGPGETPIRIDLSGYDSGAFFVPYLPPKDSGTCFSRPGLFTYDDVVTSPKSVTIRGDGGPSPEPKPPVDPELAGITYTIGDASGEPGDVVELPVLLDSFIDLHTLRVVLDYDETRLELVEIVVPVESYDGTPAEETLPADGSGFVNCDRLASPECQFGFPAIGQLQGAALGDTIAPGAVNFWLSTSYEVAGGIPGKDFWIGGIQYEIARLHFRVLDNWTGTSEIRGASTTWTRQGALHEETSVSAGYPPLGDPSAPRLDVPAITVVTGTVTRPGTVRFLRGDTDLSGALRMNDAVQTLGFLFQGNVALNCQEAADSNDDGILNIADAIYTLHWLFVGGPQPPAPYPDAGIDPTADTLGCEVGL